MTDIFEKGIENLDNRDPVIVLCGEVGSMVGRFVDGDVSESETTEKLINIYHTKFDGKADEFEEILRFMKSNAAILPEKTSNAELDKNDIKLKDILNNLLISLEVDDIEHIYDMFTLAGFQAITIGLVDEEKNHHSITLNEVISPNKMNVDVIVNDNDKEDAVHNPLWYVLNKIDEKSAENVDVEDNGSENPEKVDFYGKEVLVGDKTKINFVDDEKNKSSVSMGNDLNSMNVAHEKNKEVSRVAVDSTIKGVVDYMFAKGDVPFDFVINTKTEDFKKNFVGSVIMHLIYDRIKSNNMVNSVSKDMMFADKITSFVIDGISISYKDFSEFKSYDDFVAFEEKMKNKDKENVRKNLLENEIINNVSR